MNQCLQITFTPKKDLEALYEFIQKQASKCGIEGTMQTVDATGIRVMACGSRDDIEKFLDMLHAGVAEKKLDEIEIEPFLKDRDYRGVFRVIESR